MNEILRKLMLLIQSAGTAVDESQVAQKAKNFFNQNVRYPIEQRLPIQNDMFDRFQSPVYLQDAINQVNQSPVVAGAQKLGKYNNELFDKYIKTIGK